MRLFNRRKSKITPFLDLERDAQHQICEGVSQDLLQEYRLQVSPERIAKVFRFYQVEVVCYKDLFDLVSDKNLKDAFSSILRG